MRRIYKEYYVLARVMHFFLGKSTERFTKLSQALIFLHVTYLYILHRKWKDRFYECIEDKTKCCSWQINRNVLSCSCLKHWCGFSGDGDATKVAISHFSCLTPFKTQATVSSHLSCWNMRIINTSSAPLSQKKKVKQNWPVSSQSGSY